MHEQNPELTHHPINREALHEQRLRDIAHVYGSFVENRYLQLGDSDSGHGVMFGKLRPYGDVAIKPFETLGRAQHELEVIDYAKGLGLDTLDPLDLESSGRFVYLVTRYRPDLRHLGQLDWSANVASKHLSKVLTPTLHFAADFAGKIHGLGITHGDYQVKNIARTKDGEPVLADVENGQIRLRGNELAIKGNRDLIRFLTSTIRRGFLYDRSTNYRLGFLATEFVEPALESEGTPIPAMNDRRTDVVNKVADILLTQDKYRHPSSRTKIPA